MGSRLVVPVLFQAEFQCNSSHIPVAFQCTGTGSERDWNATGISFLVVHACFVIVQRVVVVGPSEGVVDATGLLTCSHVTGSIGTFCASSRCAPPMLHHFTEWQVVAGLFFGMYEHIK